MRKLLVLALAGALFGPLVTAGCDVEPGILGPANPVGEIFRISDRPPTFEIEVEPRFRHRVPDRDSSLRLYSAHPD